MYYLIEANSESIKIYQKKNDHIFLLERVSYQFQNSYCPRDKIDFTDDDSGIIFDIFLKLKNKYLLSKSNTKIYATGHFRNIINSERFIENFYTQIGLYFNIINQDLEDFYLEKKFSNYSFQIGKTIIFNIDGNHLDFILCDKGNLIDSKRLPFGVDNIQKEDFSLINEKNDSNFLSVVVESVMKRLPYTSESFDTAIYIGGGLTFMQILEYPLRENNLFSDVNHPYLINISDYIRHNKNLFDKLTIGDLLSKMPENPTRMLGARAYGAIAQAICMQYGVKQIIPSNFSMIDGVASQEVRTAVICGSFNRHLNKISSLIDVLENKGIKILSPKNTLVVDNKDGFVIFENDLMINNCKWSVESRHLNAIKDCDMVIACNFDNYIGFSTAFEIGYAYSHGKKVVFLENNDIALNFDSPSEIGLLCI
ncbi:MAG: hypothetical protein IJB12_03715 [Methanocorpusculum sp.]|nr:hypothetical protein [Methanocorpusculum sp.]